MNIEDVARICHEANKALCETQGDFSQPSWEETEEWQRQSSIEAVKYALENPKKPAYAQHNAWMEYKINDGWVYGEVKDVDKKTHPCIVAYDQLPDGQKAKDYLIKGIVNSLAKFIE